MKMIPFLVIKLFHFISSLRFLLEKYKKSIVYVAKLSNSSRVNYSDRSIIQFLGMRLRRLRTSKDESSSIQLQRHLLQL